MIWATIIAAAAAVMPVPTDAYWAFKLDDGSFLWVMESETQRSSGQVSTWIHSYIPGTARKPHETVSEKVAFDCQGGMDVLAWTVYNAQGVAKSSWDGYRHHLNRPGTAFSNLSDKLCKG